MSQRKKRVEDGDDQALPETVILAHLIETIVMLADANLQPGWVFDAHDVDRWLGFRYDVRVLDATLKEMGRRKLIRATTWAEGVEAYASMEVVW